MQYIYNCEEETAPANSVITIHGTDWALQMYGYGQFYFANRFKVSFKYLESIIFSIIHKNTCYTNIFHQVSFFVSYIVSIELTK